MTQVTQAPPESATKPTPPSSACESVTLAAVVDGDTLRVRSSKGIEKVRVSQIDAPERSQQFGIESTSCLAAAVASSSLEICRDGIDRYGRTVANVRAGGVDVAGTVVAQGCAWVYYKYLEANSALPALEQAAKQARLGLWAGEAVAPWTYRSGVSPVPVSTSTGLPVVAVASANQATAYNRVFDWAEHEYPEMLPKGGLNQTLPDGTIFRCYSNGVCIGYRSGLFLSYDGTTVREVGSEAVLIKEAEAQGF